MNESAIQDLGQFHSFNDFFTRSLCQGARPIDRNSRAVISPCDGTVSEFGAIINNQLVQAKGQHFTLEQLLAGQPDLHKKFYYGSFCTIYLSPKDYHRVHMAMDGELESMIYVPGRLFSVAPYAPKTIQALFARNERVISVFRVAGGWMCSIMVGAVNVAAIETAWHGLVTPPHKKQISRTDYQSQDKPITLTKGDQMGVFNMGSTVILLFSPNLIQWVPALRLQQNIRLGQPLAYLR